MNTQENSLIKRAITFIKSPRGETVRYIIIGGCTTAVDYLTYHAMLDWLSFSVTASSVTSTALAIVFAYITNKLFVFVSKTGSFGALAAEFGRFMASRLVTFGLEVGGVYLLVNILEQNEYLGKIASIIVVIIVNYILSKFIVFRPGKQEEPLDE